MARQKTVYSSCLRGMWRSKCDFRRAKTASRACRSNHSICNVWRLPSAETVTCVVPNVFVTLEVLVLPSGCDSEQKYAGVRQTQKVSVRAEHAFPPTQAVYTRQLIRGSRVASLLCLAALARLGNVKMLAAFGGLPRFARRGLASLGLA